MKPARFRLAAFLGLACLLGSAVGMLARVPRYRCLDGVCDGFYVQGMWRKRWGHPEELLYLLAFPEGEQFGGGATEWPLHATGSPGVRCHPYGVYVRGERSVPPNGYGVWVYRPTVPQGGVRFVEVPSPLQLRLGMGDFATLADSPMWQRHIRPALVEESVNWREDFERRHGPIGTRRIPRRADIDWQNLDALFPRKPP